MTLGMMVEGKWIKDWTERDTQGKFVRMPTKFHNWVTADGSSGFKVEPGRYHLYVSLGCPWAHRTAIMRSVKGLNSVISMSIVKPEISDFGWEFSEELGCIPDTINQANYLWEIYVKAKSDYTGRVTVPILWDKQTGTIVNNESQQIIRMLDTEFEAFAQAGVNFYPQELGSGIERTIDAIYQPINNGVYRCGFASNQSAYDEAVTELFAALDYWEKVLQNQRYLVGNQITEADWCLFPTLFRFDAAYHGLFKCDVRRLRDYPNLGNYLLDLYQQPRVKEVCSIDHVKRLYYGSLGEINPSRIVPKGPMIDLNAAHDRDRFLVTPAQAVA